MITVGIYGFGNIAIEHMRAYEYCNKIGMDVKVVAVCDIRIGRTKYITDPAVHFYYDIYDMIRNEVMNTIDICLPTYLHADATIEMLKLGYNVICEKPMALTVQDCDRMIEAAVNSKGKLMIGQCLRFSKPYLYLKQVVDDNLFGKPISAIFQRIGSFPSWGWENWFMDTRKSGGCIVDQHIHDIDIIRFIFGEPQIEYVNATGSREKTDCIITILSTPDCGQLIAMSDWGLREGVPFQEEYRVNFETASIVYKNGIVTLFKKMRPGREIEIEKISAIQEEIAYFVEYIEDENNGEVCSLYNARDSLRIINAIEKMI